MNKPSWTPEPWVERESKLSDYPTSGWKQIRDEDYDRARVCVNACKGIDPAGIPFAVAALEAFEKAARQDTHYATFIAVITWRILSVWPLKYSGSNHE